MFLINCKYKKTTVFRELLNTLKFKDEVFKKAINYAKNHLSFNFTLVFYDVTTLYFETDKDDNLRKTGFSKENKINNPQILVGILVEKTGFPLYFDFFKENTFEGKTFIPTILKIKNKYKIDTFTVVADSGMLSSSNLKELEENNLKYIVSTRVKKPNIQ
jgi:transposase